MESPSYDEIHATAVGFLIVFLYNLTGDSEVVVLLLTAILGATDGVDHLADTRREIAYASAGAVCAELFFGRN